MAETLPTIRVAIDLSFGEQMNSREHRSLSAQLLRAYGLNRKHPTPLSLHLAALDAARAEAPECLPPAEHLQAWQDGGMISLLDQPASEAWPGETVWLSPDAEEPLTAPLSPDVVYVLSGLIDRSVAKGASLSRARDCGAPAFRLPVREHASRSDVHPILSLPACVTLLADVRGGVSWERAFDAALPKRYVQRREFEEAQRVAAAAAERDENGGDSQNFY